MQTPFKDQDTSVSIPILLDPPTPERSRGWFVLILFSVGLMSLVFSLMTGQGTPNPTPQDPPTPAQGPALVTLIIEAQPAEARVQVAAVSLGQTIRADGRVEVQLSPGEDVGFTVSLDGHQTVQGKLAALDETKVIELQPLPVPARIAAAPKRLPSAPQRSQLAPSAPSGCSR